MRARTPRRLAAVALSTAIVIGSAGTAMAAGSPPPRAARAEAPVPGADSLLGQAQRLNGLGGVLTPVTDLLTGVLKGASPADTAALAGKATAALDAVQQAAPAATPPAAAGPAAVPLGGPEQDAVLAAARDDAVATVKKGIDDLVKAVTSLNVGGVLPAATSVVTGLVGLVLTTVTGGGLPVPDLPGLPKVPTDAVPKLPA
ncbi:hypothetical protein ACFW17_33480 [Streptomyces sp. NPDC058961]|uniref:hypothetical protein n=1 Tax=Streptomyces sp. NPDC058961 TaxID=3346680 RepID=UPI0036CE4BA7